MRGKNPNTFNITISILAFIFKGTFPFLKKIKKKRILTSLS